MMNEQLTVEERIASARLKKAMKLVTAIHSVGGTAVDLDLEDFPWDDAVRLASVRPPSDETKALVREALVFHDEMDEKRRETLRMI